MDVFLRNIQEAEKRLQQARKPSAAKRQGAMSSIGFEVVHELFEFSSNASRAGQSLPLLWG